jgi:microcystin-dependent protein
MQELCNRLETVLSQLKSGGAIPGEVRMWSGPAVPEIATYGRWVWADGASYVSATFPQASAHIAAAWRTHAGKADPGAGNFRVPDLRGSAPIGMDAMPGGARANRMARAVSAVLAGVSGEEYHTLAASEMPSHGHGVSDPGHAHAVADPGHNHPIEAWVSGANPDVIRPTGNTAAAPIFAGYVYTNGNGTGIGIYGAGTGISIQGAGGGGVHENTPTATFVPWIVKLDD